MLVLLCNTPRKDNQKQWRWFNLGVWGLGVFVDVLLIWVDSKISTINLMTGMILKLILNVFKKKKKTCLFFDRELIFCADSLASLLPSLCCWFIWERGVGLVQVWAIWRHEHKWKYQPYQYRASHSKANTFLNRTIIWAVRLCCLAYVILPGCGPLLQL